MSLVNARLLHDYGLRPESTDRFCMKSTGFSSFGKLHRRYFSVPTRIALFFA